MLCPVLSSRPRDLFRPYCSRIRILIHRPSPTMATATTIPVAVFGKDPKIARAVCEKLLPDFDGMSFARSSYLLQCALPLSPSLPLPNLSALSPVIRKNPSSTYLPTFLQNPVTYTHP